MRIESKRHRIAEKISWNKHVVAAGLLVRDAGSTPAASTISVMGRTYLFTCPKCEYRARVSGGADEGEQFHIQTIACEDCRELFDAVVKSKSFLKAAPADKAQRHFHAEESGKPAPKFSAMLNRLPLRGPRLWWKFKPICPVWAKHRIRNWRKPDRCPKCGAFMEQEALPFRIWD